MPSIILSITTRIVRAFAQISLNKRHVVVNINLHLSKENSLLHEYRYETARKSWPWFKILYEKVL